MNKHVITAGFAALMLSGCQSLELVTSLPRNQLPSIMPLYDQDSQIMYMVSNDEDHLYLKLTTTNRESIGKVIRNGLYVYFDVKGKKNKQVFLNYPLENSMQRPMGNRPDQDRGTPGGPGRQGEPGRPDELKQFGQIPAEAVFSKFGEEESILFALYDTDIKPSITADSNSAFVYDLAIPFTRIAEGGLASISVLSVGIESEVTDRGSQERGSPPDMSDMGGGPGGMGGGRPPGGMGGGPPGGQSESMPSGMGGGGPGGGGPGGGPGGMDRSSMFTPIEIWFRVDLYR